MKKFMELIRTKEREEKSVPNNKKISLKEEKPPIQVQAPNQANDPQNDLFWDDYSDVGYC
jgi:hypothetical protein